jgi:hypothetical protein
MAIENLPPLPRSARGTIIGANTLATAFRANLDRARQKVNGHVVPEMMQQICAQLDEVIESYMTEFRAGNIKPIHQAALAQVTQYVTDLDPEAGLAQADAEAFAFFPSAYLSQQESDALADLEFDFDEEKLPYIQAGILKWQTDTGHLNMAQRAKLAANAKQYMEHLYPNTGANDAVKIEGFSFADFLINGPFNITYLGHTVTVPCDWNSLELFIKLVANECLEKEMERAKAGGYADFDKFVVHLHDSQKQNSDHSLELIKTQIHTFKLNKAVNMIAALDQMDLDADADTPPVFHNPLLEDNEPASPLPQAAPGLVVEHVELVEVDDLIAKDAELLVEQIRLFASWCNDANDDLPLENLLEQLEFSPDFLERYCPNDYLSKADRAKNSRLDINISAGLKNFVNLTPEQKCRLVADSCVHLERKLAEGGYSVTFIPTYQQASSNYFQWSKNFQIDVKKGDITFDPLLFKSNDADLQKFVENVHNGSLITFISTGYRVISNPSSRSTTPAASGSRSTTPAGGAPPPADKIGQSFN